MIKEACKGGPKWPNIGKIRGPNRSTKRYKTRRWRSVGTGLGRAHHGPWWEVHGCAPCHAWSCMPFVWRVSVFFVPLRSPAIFAVFLLIMLMYLDIWGYPIHSYSILPFISISIKEVCRERKRERRRTARILDWILRSKDGSAVLDEQFFPFSSLFSI